MLAKVANKDTRSVVSALIKQARKLPSELYKSLTWDRGKELSDHAGGRGLSRAPRSAGAGAGRGPALRLRRRACGPHAGGALAARSFVFSFRKIVPLSNFVALLID